MKISFKGKMHKIVMVILFLLVGLAVLCVLCKNKSKEGMTHLDINDKSLEDEIGQSSIEIIEPDDTFTASPGFGSGPGTIGFGRAGSSFGN